MDHKGVKRCFDNDDIMGIGVASLNLRHDYAFYGFQISSCLREFVRALKDMYYIAQALHDDGMHATLASEPELDTK